jgi:general secretion pathway protein A
MNADHPFTSVHHSELILPTDAYRGALKRLGDGLGDREPFLLVTGEPGTGKTTLVLEAVSQWDTRVAAAFVSNPALTRTELLEEIARRFGAEPPADATKPLLLARLERAFAELAEGDRIPVIVVEDAHLLAAELLEELRLLTTTQARARRRLRSC